MSMMDFMRTPHSGPSRQGQVQFDASEILRLWGESDTHHLLRNLQRAFAAHEGYKVAAILPTQELSAAEYELLEDSGVLVVEVPTDLAESSEAGIAAYLTAQLNDGAQATAARMAAIGTTDPSVTTDGQNEVQLSDEEEAEFLEFVNDPANQLGGHF